MHGVPIRLLAGAGVLAIASAACGGATGSGGSSSSSSSSAAGSASGSANGALKTGPGVDTASKTITLGVLTPLSGPAALIGKPLTAGQQAYFDSVNANGGIDGWKVKLDVQDSKYDPQTQAQEYNQIIGSVLFIAQSLGSPTTQAIESQASSQGVVLGTAAQDSAFVTQKINAVIGTPYAVDVANGLAYVTQTLGKKNAKIGIIYQNDAYGQDGLKGFTAAQQAFHFNDVGHATYNVTDTSFTSQALAMKNAGAQYVVLTAIPPAAGGIIGSAAAIGYHPQWILQGPAWSEYLMTSTGVASGSPTPIEKAMVGSWVLGYEAEWGDTSVPGMARFLADTKKYMPNQIPDGYYMYGYAMAEMEVKLLQKAIANKDLTRQGVLNAKLNLGTIDFGGLIPNADYTPNLGPADRKTEVSQVDLTSPGFLKVIHPFTESAPAQSMTFGSGG